MCALADALNPYTLGHMVDNRRLWPRAQERQELDKDAWEPAA